MTDIIDSRKVGVVEGFDIEAHLEPDIEWSVLENVEDDEQLRAAWLRDEWSFVSTVVTASRAGVPLGSSSLGGSQYGAIPGVSGWVSPLDGEGDQFINGYGPQMIDEAVTAAKQKLIEIGAPQ